MSNGFLASICARVITETAEGELASRCRLRSAVTTMTFSSVGKLPVGESVGAGVGVWARVRWRGCGAGLGAVVGRVCAFCPNGRGDEQGGKQQRFHVFEKSKPRLLARRDRGDKQKHGSIPPAESLRETDGPTLPAPGKPARASAFLPHPFPSKASAHFCGRSPDSSRHPRPAFPKP